MHLSHFVVMSSALLVYLGHRVKVIFARARAHDRADDIFQRSHNEIPRTAHRNKPFCFQARSASLCCFRCASSAWKSKLICAVASSFFFCVSAYVRYFTRQLIYLFEMRLWNIVKKRRLSRPKFKLNNGIHCMITIRLKWIVNYHGWRFFQVILLLCHCGLTLVGCMKQSSEADTLK